MSDKTGIEWTDATWNPVRGCSRVSQGCVHCYAESVARRFSGPGQPYDGLIDSRTGGWNGKVRFVPDALSQPLRWKRPRRIFVNSMSDLFHENITDDQIDRIFAVMALSPRHTFQVLTKRPERMLAWATHGGDGRWGYVDGRARQIWREYSGKEFPAGKMLPFKPLPNVWLGVSVENQAAADERIPLLLQTPAKVRFLSCEPLLGPISFRWAPYAHVSTGETYREYLERTGVINEYEALMKLDWVIVGGESGRNARPMEASWALGLRDQCNAAGVAFFFKQWGEYLPPGQDGNPDSDTLHINASELPIRIGKKAAGRLLDGRVYSEYPA